MTNQSPIDPHHGDNFMSTTTDFPDGRGPRDFLCPDCDSEVRVKSGPDAIDVDVFHSPTCPKMGREALPQIPVQRSNHPSGEQLRDQGMADVLDADTAVNRDVREHIDRAIDQLIAAGGPFTADHVYVLLPTDIQPHSPNLFGAAFHARRRAGDIACIGVVTSGRSSRRAGMQRQWIASHAAGEVA